LRNIGIEPFTGPGGEQKAERAGHWLKSLAGNTASRRYCAKNGIALTKATNEAGNATGGFLVPTAFDQAILAVRDTVGAFRMGADVRTYRSDNAVRPRRTGGLTATFTQEGLAIPESSLTFDAVGVNLKGLKIHARSSSELWDDEAIDLANYVVTEIGYAFAAAEDDAGFNGDGTSTYWGIQGLGPKLVGLKSAINAASGHNTYSLLDNTDLTNLMAGVLATGITDAKWYISATGYAQTMARLAGTGGGLVAYQRADGTIRANYLGFPVVFSSKLPNVQSSLSGKLMMAFGDLSQSSVIADSQSGTAIDVSEDRYLDSDQVAVRGVRRLDIVNHSIGDASTYGPIAALYGN
jgi:HK97 family phage major capsid protein